MKTAKPIMIQGTASNAGKSIVTAGLCRIFARDGYKVAPFKSQNMALNSYITKDGLEMGRAQVVQAEASFREPDIRMNPVLLKPVSDRCSQVIVGGEAIGNMDAKEYFAHKQKLIPHILKSYESLAQENDIIVIEGAGSPAEINLKEADIVNMGMARLAGAPVLIVGDIDRGGLFASLYGTYMLQSEEEKGYIKGNIINKFRGDLSLLKPGIEMLEKLIPVPTVGVIPYVRLDLDDEDSLSARLENGTPSPVDIAVIRLPRISNFTDFNSFEALMGSGVRYVTRPSELRDPDLVILPGTKNTIGDMKWLRESGLEAAVLKHAGSGKPLFGICGGYQLLSRTLKDPANVEGGGEIKGLGLIDADTVFEKEKVRVQVKGRFGDVTGIFGGLSGLPFEGYEIHMGRTSGGRALSALTAPDGTVKEGGHCRENIYGSYVHGIFDSGEVLRVICKALAQANGLSYLPKKVIGIKEYKNGQYDRLADILRRSLDTDMIYKILDRGI